MISTTTRNPREGEENAKDYYFVPGEQFGKMRRGGELVEFTTINGNCYGVTQGEVERLASIGKTPILIADSSGRKKWKDKYGKGIVDVIISAPEVIRRRRLIRRLIRTARLQVTRRLSKSLRKLSCMMMAA